MLEFCICDNFRHLHKIVKPTISFIISVCLHVTTWLPLDGFSWNFIFEYFFFLICWENLSFIKVWQEKRVLYMKMNIHFWSCLTQFLLQWEMFQTIFVEKMGAHILCAVSFFRKSYHLRDNVEKIKEMERPQCGACTFHVGYLRLQANTFRICNTYCFSAARMASRMCLYVTLNVHCVPCYSLM